MKFHKPVIFVILFSFSGTFGDPVLGDQLALFMIDPFVQIFDDSTPGELNIVELSANYPSEPNDNISGQAGSFTLATITFNTI